MNALYRIFLLFVLASMVTTYGCPYNIKNDTTSPIIAIDIHSNAAIYITPGQALIIDPSIQNKVLQYVQYEKLDIYEPIEKGSHTFQKTYQLVEKHCEPGTAQLTLSQIKEFVHSPTDRFYATAYTLTEQKEPVAHHHHAKSKLKVE